MIVTRKLAWMATAAALIAVPALAKVDMLPDYAYDMVAEVTMAATADQKCQGIKARSKRVEKHVLALYQKLMKEGISVQDAVEHLQGEAALAEIARREKDLRERHGVAAQGDEALCAAIRAEARENDAVADLMRIR